MKRPATSYVPLVTNPGPGLSRPGTPATAVRRRPQAGCVRNGRAGVLARAEAAARPPRPPPVTPRPAAENPGGPVRGGLHGSTPVAANSAYGLDPLDAATAGLGRARRLRLVQLVVLALGVMALIAGIILIITGLSG